MLSEILITFIMVVSPKLVLFQENLGQVAEVREIELEKGKITVNLVEIPRELILESFDIYTPKKDLELLSARWLFDLTPEVLLKKSIGKTVTLLEEKTTLTYNLLGYDGKYIYLRDSENRMRLLEREKISHLIFPEMELTIVPTLLLTLNSKKKGKSVVTISYLTTGLSWRAQYEALLDGKNLKIKGSALIENITERDYIDAELSLFAGKLEKIPARPMRMEMLAEKGAAEPVKFGEDFFRFALPGKWNLLRKSQTKALFLDESIKNFEKEYVFDAQRWRAGKVRIRVKAENRTEAPFPPGEVYLYTVENMTPRLVHLSRIDLIPVGGKFELDFGPSEEIEAERKEIFRERITRKEYRVKIEVTVRNGKKEPVLVKVIEHPESTMWEIVESNFPYEKIDVHTVEFKVNIPGKSEETLRVTYRLTY